MTSMENGINYLIDKMIVFFLILNNFTYCEL